MLAVTARRRARLRDRLPTYAFLVDRPVGTSNAFVARTRESASPDAVCTVGETPAAQLRVCGCAH